MKCLLTVNFFGMVLDDGLELNGNPMTSLVSNL